MIKEVLFDADGVVIRTRGKYFSQRLAERQELDIGKVLPFFKGEYQLCATGKADLREILPRYFDTWRWTGTLDELLEFWFEGERDLDDGVMGVVDDLRARGVKVGLATDNEKYRGGYLLDEVGLRKRFDDIFGSWQMGMKKSDPEFFGLVMATTGLSPGEIQYWDDDQKNVDVARQRGIDGRLFTSSEELKRSISDSSR